MRDAPVLPETASANAPSPQGGLFPPQRHQQTGPAPGERFRRGTASLHFGLAEDCYAGWPAPVCLISDGPYGVDGFPGDCRTAESLADWYEPHVRVWSARSTPATTLWFWNTEIGWANVHPLLREYGWEYRCCNIWDKGIGHIAGNANTKTLRKFPIVTEVCVHYVKAARFTIGERTATMQEWLRSEWRRTGLPLRAANDACEVSNAATRKYLTADHLWYYPPVEAFARLVAYANEHGRAAGRPFFSVDGRRPLSGREWAALRAKFSCAVGVTNVWREPQVGGAERIQGSRNGMKYKFRSLHGSQKPLRLIERIVRASTDRGDVVWEPFGGLCPGAVVAFLGEREYYAAEKAPEFYLAARERLAAT